ncbi:MFS general substrate transporter [Guyanagaster necrorhizus]|uniref:MFS general substrate transporter n=1 Tax=Guyanagaster necrorhizus TaxID=856835 RepID=A0A9P7VZB8_9AGAR|nr:MFS general substrate transporter [Guyanagaster necrorhizus MCA 3950]KAG7449348.1 MFS general substrate transporter [Guyanagaster necrorhizus MCA 3950]
MLPKVRTLLLGDIPPMRQEAKLLWKIDWFILSYCCLQVNLDRSNISNAYVSGMKEELHMYGNEYNKINTVFTCGYIVGMIPNNLMLQIVPPHIWLPCMQILWGVLTFCTSAVHNVQSIYAIRFFQAMAESSTFVGTHYILGSWFSGVLQAAIYKHLNGYAGRSGWRWLFIIDGVITLPIAIYGFVIFPDMPLTTKAFYLTEQERKLASDRLQDEIQVVRKPVSRATVKRILGKWRWYGCSLLFAISGETESFGSNNIMGQWMKAIGGYSVEQIDYYPSGATAFAIASTLICASWTDYTRIRWPVLVYMSVACSISATCLLIWNSPTGLKFFAFYIAGASYAGQATTFAWANQICADDDQERGIVLASMNMWNNVINAWWPLVFYLATDAPRFHRGMIAMICVSGATLGVTGLVWYLERREKIAQKKVSDDYDEGLQGDRNSLNHQVTS